jgi:hypothetical protein
MLGVLADSDPPSPFNWRMGCYRQERLRGTSFRQSVQRGRPRQRARFRPKSRPRSKQRPTISAMRQLYFCGKGAPSGGARFARAWRILSETALLAIYLLLFVWNILNVRFV